MPVGASTGGGKTRAQTPDTTNRGDLAGVVRAEAHVVTAGSPRRLHGQFRTPPVRRGVLPREFEWVLLAMLTEVDPGSVAWAEFPDREVRGALVIAAELAD